MQSNLFVNLAAITFLAIVAYLIGTGIGNAMCS